MEATKFTEVGYVGREVDSIIRDLMDISVKMTRENAMSKVGQRAEDAAEERILDALLPGPARSVGFTADSDDAHDDGDTRQKFRIITVTDDTQRNRPGAGQTHNWPGRGKTSGSNRSQEPLAPRAGGRTTA